MLTSLDLQVAEHTGGHALHQLAIDLRLTVHPVVVAYGVVWNRELQQVKNKYSSTLSHPQLATN